MMEGTARNWNGQQHQQWQRWGNVTVDTRTSRQPQHHQLSGAGASITTQSQPENAMNTIKHGKTHSELVQYYTSLYHAWLEKYKEATAADEASAALQNKTNEDALQVDIMIEMEEIVRRERWTQQTNQYANDSLDLVHYHLALSRRGEQHQHQQHQHQQRPASPPFIPPSITYARSSSPVPPPLMKQRSSISSANDNPLSMSNQNNPNPRLLMASEANNNNLSNSNSRVESRCITNSAQQREGLLLEGLLPNWIAVQDTTSGSLYYANTVTGESTWDRPDGATATSNLPPCNQTLPQLQTMGVSQQQPSQVVNDNLLPQNWIAIRDSNTGHIYYWNQVEKVTSWTRPDTEASNANMMAKKRSLEQLSSAGEGIGCRLEGRDQKSVVAHPPSAPSNMDPLSASVGESQCSDHCDSGEPLLEVSDNNKTVLEMEEELLTSLEQSLAASAAEAATSSAMKLEAVHTCNKNPLPEQKLPPTTTDGVVGAATSIATADDAVAVSLAQPMNTATSSRSSSAASQSVDTRKRKSRWDVVGDAAHDVIRQDDGKYLGADTTHTRSTIEDRQEAQQHSHESARNDSCEYKQRELYSCELLNDESHEYSSAAKGVHPPTALADDTSRPEASVNTVDRALASSMTNLKRTSRKSRKLADKVSQWTGGNDEAVRRAAEAIHHKQWSHACPVCDEKLPTRETRDLHVICMTDKRHVKYRKQPGSYYAKLMAVASAEPSASTCSGASLALSNDTDPLSNRALVANKFLSSSKRSSALLQYLPSPFPKTLTCTKGASPFPETQVPERNGKKRKREASATPDARAKKPKILSNKQKRRDEYMEEQKDQLISRVKLWSDNNEDVVDRARKSIQHLTTWKPKRFSYICPVAKCKTRLPTQEILDLHINHVGNKKHKAFRRMQRDAANKQSQHQPNTARLDASRKTGGAHAADNEMLLRQDQTNMERMEKKKARFIDRVKLWSDYDENLVRRTEQAIQDLNLTTWHPHKSFPFPCPVPRCTHCLPTQETLDLHLNKAGDKKHKACREQRNATNHSLQSKSSPATSSLLRENFEQQTSNSASQTSSMHKRGKPLQFILIIDTCCLVGDNGVAAVEELLKLANKSFYDKAEGESIDTVIPFKVWGELEGQSKRKDCPQTAFEARSAMRLLRAKLEQNAAANSNACNALRSNALHRLNILRSQTILDSREAANKFLSTLLQSTNDDHILACAMLEKERANRLLPFQDLDVVILTRDNNLACKAYANDLKVDSLSAFLSKYKQRMSLFKRNRMTSAAQGNYTSTVSSSSKVDTEVIELLSDDDDEVIDLTTTPTKAKG